MDGAFNDTFGHRTFLHFHMFWNNTHVGCLSVRVSTFLKLVQEFVTFLRMHVFRRTPVVRIFCLHKTELFRDRLIPISDYYIPPICSLMVVHGLITGSRGHFGRKSFHTRVDLVRLDHDSKSMISISNR